MMQKQTFYDYRRQDLQAILKDSDTKCVARLSTKQENKKLITTNSIQY